RARGLPSGRRWRLGPFRGLLLGRHPRQLLDARAAVEGLLERRLLDRREPLFPELRPQAAAIARLDELPLRLLAPEHLKDAILTDIADPVAHRADLRLVLDQPLPALLEELARLVRRHAQLLEHVRRGLVRLAAVDAQLPQQLLRD